MPKLEITLKITADIDGTYDNSMEDLMFEKVTEGISGVFDLSEDCMLFSDTIELASVSEVI